MVDSLILNKYQKCSTEMSKNNRKVRYEPLFSGS